MPPEVEARDDHDKARALVGEADQIPSLGRRHVSGNVALEQYLPSLESQKH